MSNAEEKTVTVALNCAVKVSGALYSTNDVIRVPEDIARRLVEQGAADLYEIPVEDGAAPEVEEAAQPDGGESEAGGENPDGDDETSGGGDKSDGSDDGKADGESEKPARKGRGSRSKSDD